MKSITLFIILFLPVLAFAHNFKTENGAIIWQKVYDTTDSVTMKSFGSAIAEATHNVNTITGKIINSKVNYSISGVKRMQIPLYMNEPFGADVLIEYKSGKYRVTVFNISFKEPEDGSMLTSESSSPMGDYALNSSGEIRQNQQKALEVFDADLSLRFTMKSNNEW